MDGAHQHIGTSSDSEGPAVRPPIKRVKSKSRVWERVSWFSRKSRTTKEGHIELSLTGEEGGAAAIPDQMEVDDMPSSSSGPSPRPLSDYSSSSEGDIASLSLRTAGHNNGKKSNSSSRYSNSEVVYQNCVKPSLVKVMFGKADNNVCSTRIHIPRRTTKKKIEQMNLSDDDEDEDELEASKCHHHTRNQLNDSSKLKNAWFDGNRHAPCHCPACCSCRHSSEAINFASWPRKRTCPLQVSLRLCRADVPMAVKHSPSTSRKDMVAGPTCSKASWCPSGDITMSNLSLHADQPWAAKKRVQGEQARRCCCPRRVEYGRKSLSLPAGASLDSYSLDKLDTTSFSAIEHSEVECMVTVDSASDHELPLQDEQNCQRKQSAICNQDNPKCNHGEGGDHQHQQSSLTWNKGVDGSVFKQRMQVIGEWFGEFNDQQKNVMMKRLLEQCDLPQMHMLSVTMEPILHQSCPHNCQDLLSWLPSQLSLRILSYLDPVSLCRCASVSRAWYELANEPTLWRTQCRLLKWRLTQAEEQKQMINHMSSYIHWKLVFFFRYRLRRNWLKGLCTVRTFEGHTQGISCVQFDDTRIVSGSSDKSIKVWNIRTNSPWSVQTLVGHSGTVRCLHLEGNRLVSGSTDRTIKVWDLSMQNSWSSIACKVTMTGHQDTVRCLQVDYEKVVSGSYDRTLKVWDIRTGRCKLTLRGHTGAVLCLQFDSSKIVSGSVDKTIKLWSLDSGTCLSTLTGHQDAVTCLQFDANKIISGSLDSNLKFWDLHTGQCTSTIDWAHSEGHTGVIRCLQADVWRVVSAADDRTLKVWSIETGERLVTLRHHRDGVTCLQFNNSKIVSGSYDKTVKLWDFSTV
ncbi:uncharacterized protein [Amphiura filiformis]|uniref:uncharacterized protein n=1 Tax=Amphiura filiformis TaxID=82378 RepID=UPI003B20D2D8